MKSINLTLTALAALAGAAGVLLAAAGAHVNADPRLQTASHILLPHAVAALGFVAHSRASPSPRGFTAAAGLLLLGAGLFAADMTLRAVWGVHLIPYLAPTGGLLMVAGWLVGVAAATSAAMTPRAPLPPEREIEI